MAKIKTREQAIEELVDNVRHWDNEVILSMAEEIYCKELARLSDEELESEYNDNFCNQWDDGDNSFKIVNTTASKLLLDK